MIMSKNIVYEAPRAECRWIVMEQNFLLSGETTTVEDTTPVDGFWE